MKNKLTQFFYVISVVVSILGYVWFVNLPFPYITESSPSIIFSIIFFSFFSVYFLRQLFLNNLVDLAFLFNSIWIFSICLSMLALSRVQNTLSISFLIFLFVSLFAFNFGYRIKYNRKKLNLKTVNNNLNFLLLIYESFIFKFYFFVILIICISGYLYQIYIIGIIPIISATTDGFYENRAGFLSIIHYFSTSLGAISGTSLAFFLITKKSKLFYGFVFFISFICSVSLLAKNIMFLILFFFFTFLIAHKKINSKQSILYGSIFIFLLLVSSSIRTGSSEYIKMYSQIKFNDLPLFFYWINTYFSINITHLNTYFVNGYTSTFGLGSLKIFTSLFFLKDYVNQIIGDTIIYYNGLGGNINVRPLLYTYLADFGYLSFIPILILGVFSRRVQDNFKFNRSFLSIILYAGFMYILILSVFGDFLNRLMVPISIFFIYIPYLLARKSTLKKISFSKKNG